MKPEDIEKMLFVSASEQYGDRYIEHLLEQYKIYVASADKISDRRQKANEFFSASTQLSLPCSASLRRQLMKARLLAS